MAKSKNNKLSYISVPSEIIHSLSSSSLQNLLLSPKKSSKPYKRFFSATKNPRFFFVFLFLFAFLGMLKLGLNLEPILPFSPYPCTTSQSQLSSSGAERLSAFPGQPKIGISDTESEFWKQPDGLGYRPCLDFSREYRKSNEVVTRERTKYLMVVVAGGLNQQRNQIVDAVVIARILGAALVVPILQVNVIWGDER